MQKLERTRTWNETSPCVDATALTAHVQDIKSMKRSFCREQAIVDVIRGFHSEPLVEIAKSLGWVFTGYARV